MDEVIDHEAPVRGWLPIAILRRQLLVLLAPGVQTDLFLAEMQDGLCTWFVVRPSLCFSFTFFKKKNTTYNKQHVCPG